MTDVINDEKAVVDLDAAQPQPGVVSDELVRQLAERTGGKGPVSTQTFLSDADQNWGYVMGSVLF